MRETSTVQPNSGGNSSYGRQGHGTCLRPTLFGMRRSCSECGRKKKRRCVKSRSPCKFSKRRWHLPKPPQQEGRPQRLHGDGTHGREPLLKATPPGEFATSGLLPMKRFRLSASPAIGLVGMQENTFLTDFFGCVGFLPLTTQRHIRETMVKMMASPASRRQSAAGTDCDEAPELNLLMGPSTCIFWCAVALGALVSKYSELAQKALATSYPGPADLEVGKAWAILAYLYGFMGNLGFAEIVKHKDIANSSCGQWEKKSFCAQEQATPQLKEAATEVELYQYVAQSFRAFEQTVHVTASINSATAGDHLCQAASDGRSDTLLQSDHVLLPGEVANAMGTVSASGNFLDFEPLEEAVDRPSVRGGIGSLQVNSTLVFKKAAKGDVHGALKRVGRCVQIFERYPGLCRSMIGCHLAHMMLVSLAAIGDPRAQAMYDRLRESYNSCRPSGSRLVPPLEEWHGVVAFCDDVYCRAIDLFAHKLKAFSAPPVNSIDAPVETEGADADRAKGETAHEGISDGGGVEEDTEDDSIGAEDWLDVTYSMLDAL
ncbi:expressed unknown protein [Ectocarpus siliculosus]|uniref:Uncharacterized protein n=1 Tax=Ectocarpus siliculosus TaxID=2880 RepID=D8LU08_ECTSI|nr:expressed unknown protein [Ectocarpus siliculosus]|eukprot:CBN75398.1 expressed unknown protein [Ectocarpus siliculosus]